ncbi:MAG: O-antigen ligase family protein [Clostridia bacterium]|nr:O-antigen ligase family protein [Clostridia bacterium]
MQFLHKLKSFSKENISFADIIFLITLFAVGGFNEFVSCLLSVAFSVYLFVKILKNKNLRIKINLMSISVAVIVLFYGISALWAIDSGMAFIGFLKFLPLILYLISLWQTNKAHIALDVLAYVGAIMALISAVASFIPGIKNLFLVSERLSGFFQYPNTFALFLLVCELLIISKTKFKIIDYISLAILIGGLLYTGSRTTFLLFVVSNFITVLLNANKKLKFTIIIGALSVLTVVFIIAFFGPHGNVFSRYLKFGLTESTFIGRLLYLADALPLIIKYPFGMGYMGYHFIQGSIQTGVYNVAYAHNEFLQIFLDIGIIPALLFIAAIVRFLLKKHISVSRKIMVAVICLHSLLDFNLQFIGMFMLLLLLCEDPSDKQIVLEKSLVFKIIATLLALINLYMAAALGLAHFGAREVAHSLFPYNTRNTLNMLGDEENIDRSNELADIILNQNQYYYAPFSAKAKYAYSEGDFVKVFENKHAAFERMPFRYTEYEEYCIMLINGISAYEKMGDNVSADICKEELLSTKKKLESNNQRLSRLGRMIDEQPNTQLARDVLHYIENLEQVQDNEY